jgi:hypothetical protein
MFSNTQCTDWRNGAEDFLVFAEVSSSLRLVPGWNSVPWGGLEWIQCNGLKPLGVGRIFVGGWGMVSMFPKSLRCLGKLQYPPQAITTLKQSWTVWGVKNRLKRSKLFLRHHNEFCIASCSFPKLHCCLKRHIWISKLHQYLLDVFNFSICL